MPDFAVGQRFLSDAEPELGLGIITEVEFRTISLSASGLSQMRARPPSRTGPDSESGPQRTGVPGQDASNLKEPERLSQLVLAAPSGCQ